MLVLMAGLPGVGKTTLARELAAHTAGRVISKDEIRHSLFAPREIDYSSKQDDFCLLIMLKTAGYLLRQDRDRIIFLDGRTFSRRYQIENVLREAAELHQPWRILECICPEEIVEERLREQSRAGSHPAINRDFQMYLAVKSRFEAITFPWTVIDTAQPMEICVDQALAALRLTPALSYNATLHTGFPSTF